MKRFSELFNESPSSALATLKSVAFPRDYKSALEDLIDAVEGDEKKEHTLYYWAGKIAKEYRNVDGQKLSSFFLKWLKKTDPERFLKLAESLSGEDSLSVWINDFYSSDAPQFKDKSKEERRLMAIAAYLSAKRKFFDESSLNEIDDEGLFEDLYENQSGPTRLSEEDAELISSIWEDVIENLFEPGSLDDLIESSVSNYDNLLFENVEGLPDDAQIVFGKVIKDGHQIGVVKDKKFYPITDRDSKNVDQSKASVKNVFRRMKHEIRSIAADLGESKKSIAHAFAQKDVQFALSKFGYSTKKAGDAILKTTGLINTGLAQSFQEIEKAGGLDKLKKGTQKIDEFLEKHPVIKKMAGPLAAGALIYQWNNMSFSGDFNDDFDITHIMNAAAGDYSVTDLLSTSNGAKAVTQLAIGLATGKVLGRAVSFPWKMGIHAAIVYTGAKKAGKSKLARKAMDKLKEIGNSKKELASESTSIDATKIIKDLLSDPKNVFVIDAINDGKKSVVVDFVNKNIKDPAQRKEILGLIFK